MSDKRTRVAQVINEYKVAINKGSIDGIKLGQRFIIYSLGKDIIDPETSENLGPLEIIKGTGCVIHLQERLATIYSDKKTRPQRTIRKTRPGGGLLSAYRLLEQGSEVVEEILPSEDEPFDEVTVGDFARPI